MDDHGKKRTRQTFPPASSPSLYCAGTRTATKFTLVCRIQLVARLWGSGSCDGIMQLCIPDGWEGQDFTYLA